MPTPYEELQEELRDEPDPGTGVEITPDEAVREDEDAALKIEEGKDQHL